MSKAPNYTKEQAAALVNDYKAANDEGEREQVIVNHAEKLAKPVKSIRAKLVREGVYIKKARKAKDGNAAETKASIVEDIADMIGEESETLDSLANATKDALQRLRGFLAAQ